MATSSLDNVDEWGPRHDYQQVDLAFIVDCTGSMGSYIRQAQSNISHIAETISKTAFDVRLALVEYRDHPPQEESFVVKTHDFTSSVADMKGWVDRMSASGGGDLPEAVADGLHAALNLSYRGAATKICVLIADAPPHGLHTTGEVDQMPSGCPLHHDPVKICREMARRGIIFYSIGCEPSLAAYKDFFMGLSHITGGQYISLVRADRLSKVIINSTLEEVQNEQLMGYVDDHLNLALQENDNVSVEELANSLHEVLRLNNNQTIRLQLSGRDLEPVSEMGRQVSYRRTLAEVRALMRDRFEGVAREYNPQESFDITSLDEVTPRQCERLVRRGLARRGRFPTEHSDTEMDTCNSA